MLTEENTKLLLGLIRLCKTKYFIMMMSATVLRNCLLELVIPVYLSLLEKVNLVKCSLTEFKENKDVIRTNKWCTVSLLVRGIDRESYCIEVYCLIYLLV